MIMMSMHLTDDENHRFWINELSDNHALNIAEDGNQFALFATEGQLLELSNGIMLHLATLKLKAGQVADTGEEEGEKPKYVCPNSRQHVQDGKGTGGFEVVTANIPEPHVAKIVCSVCGAHIKWESKDEMRKRESMTLNAGKDECESEGEDAAY